MGNQLVYCAKSPTIRSITYYLEQLRVSLNRANDNGGDYADDDDDDDDHDDDGDDREHRALRIEANYVTLGQTQFMKVALCKIANRNSHHHPNRGRHLNRRGRRPESAISHHTAPSQSPLHFDESHFEFNHDHEEEEVEDGIRQSSLIVIKIFPIADRTAVGSAPLPLDGYRRYLKYFAAITADQPAVCAFRIWEFASTIYLVRQYVRFSLYERLYARPALREIEKRWIAYQLLRCMDWCHQRSLVHGDLKIENILITSDLWVVVTDFAPYKPAYLPHDDPSVFNYFFDSPSSSSLGRDFRRSCSIAPERFRASTSDNLVRQNENGENFHIRLSPSVDMFSIGCIFAALFTADESSPMHDLFDLSSLLEYKKSRDRLAVIRRLASYQRSASSLSPIMGNVIESLIHLDPDQRPNCAELIRQLSVKRYFPPYFPVWYCAMRDDFIRVTPCERLRKICAQIERYLPERFDIADDNENRYQTMATFILSFICSSMHACVTAQRRHAHCVRVAQKLIRRIVRWCQIRNLDPRMSPFLTSFSYFVLDRVMPYLIDCMRRVDAPISGRIDAIDSIVDLLEKSAIFTPNAPPLDAAHYRQHFIASFNYYILNSFCEILSTSSSTGKREAADRDAPIRIRIALNIERLAVIANRISKFEITVDDGNAQSTTITPEFDALRQQFGHLIRSLFADRNVCVRRAVLITPDTIRQFCTLFDRAKIDDFILSHVATFLNPIHRYDDAEDTLSSSSSSASASSLPYPYSYRHHNANQHRQLRSLMIERLPLIARYLGPSCMPILAPLLWQAMRDDDPIVIAHAIESFATLIDARLCRPSLRSSMITIGTIPAESMIPTLEHAQTDELFDCALSLAAHRNAWIRHAVMRLISAIANNFEFRNRKKALGLDLGRTCYSNLNFDSLIAAYRLSEIRNAQHRSSQFVQQLESEHLQQQQQQSPQDLENSQNLKPPPPPPRHRLKSTKFDLSKIELSPGDIRRCRSRKIVHNRAIASKNLDDFFVHICGTMSSDDDDDDDDDEDDSRNDSNNNNNQNNQNHNNSKTYKNYLQNQISPLLIANNQHCDFFKLKFNFSFIRFHPFCHGNIPPAAATTATTTATTTTTTNAPKQSKPFFSCPNFSPFVSSSRDETIAYDRFRPAGQLLANFVEHRSSVTAITRPACMRSADTFFTASRDGTLRLWNLDVASAEYDNGSIQRSKHIFTVQKFSDDTSFTNGGKIDHSTEPTISFDGMIAFDHNRLATFDSRQKRVFVFDCTANNVLDIFCAFRAAIGSDSSLVTAIAAICDEKSISSSSSSSSSCSSQFAIATSDSRIAIYDTRLIGSDDANHHYDKYCGRNKPIIEMRLDPRHGPINRLAASVGPAAALFAGAGDGTISLIDLRFALEVFRFGDTKLDAFRIRAPPRREQTGISRLVCTDQGLYSAEFNTSAVTLWDYKTGGAPQKRSQFFADAVPNEAERLNRFEAQQQSQPQPKQQTQQSQQSQQPQLYHHNHVYHHSSSSSNTITAILPIENDGKTIILGGSDARIHVWNARDASQNYSMSGGGEDCTAREQIAFLHRDRRAARQRNRNSISQFNPEVEAAAVRKTKHFFASQRCEIGKNVRNKLSLFSAFGTKMRDQVAPPVRLGDCGDDSVVNSPMIGLEAERRRDCDDDDDDDDEYEPEIGRHIWDPLSIGIGHRDAITDLWRITDRLITADRSGVVKVWR